MGIPFHIPMLQRSPSGEKHGLIEPHYTYRHCPVLGKNISQPLLTCCCRSNSHRGDTPKLVYRHRSNDIHGVPIWSSHIYLSGGNTTQILKNFGTLSYPLTFFCFMCCFRCWPSTLIKGDQGFLGRSGPYATREIMRFDDNKCILLPGREVRGSATVPPNQKKMK